MSNNFDMGFKECEETKVAFLYARIEDAIMDLASPTEKPENKIKIVIVDLRRSLKISDANEENRFLIRRIK